MNRKDVCELLKLARELDDWMADASWPLWFEKGIHTSSRYYETLEFDGTPRRLAESRVRTQVRQVFCFALAHQMGWRPEATADHVRRALPLALSAVLRHDGIAGRTIDIGRGELLDRTADLYDTAFCLMAIARSRAIVGAVETDRMAVTLFASLDKHLRYKGVNGYRETLPAHELRQQNPHMHFYESLLLYYEMSGRDDVWDRAEEVYRFVSNLFFDEDSGVVRESARVDGTCVKPGYDPGHSMEWTWLLGYRARLGGLDLPDFTFPLYERAAAAYQKHGWTYLFLDDADELGVATARLWSQVETLKGHLSIAELGDNTRANASVKPAVQCARDIRDNWLQSETPGGWQDQFDANQRMTADGMPASTGYHLYLAIAELKRVTELLDQSTE